VLHNRDACEAIGSLSGWNVGDVAMSRQDRTGAWLLRHFVELKNNEADIEIWRSGRRCARRDVRMTLNRDELSLAKGLQFEVRDVPENVRRGHENSRPMQAKEEAGPQSLAMPTSQTENWKHVLLNRLFESR